MPHKAETTASWQVFVENGRYNLRVIALSIEKLAPHPNIPWM